MRKDQRIRNKQHTAGHPIEAHKSLKDFTEIDIHGFKVFVNTPSARNSQAPKPLNVTYSNRETSLGRNELFIDLSKINKSSKFANTDLSNFHTLLKSSLKGEVRKKKRPVRLLPVVSVELKMTNSASSALKRREGQENCEIPEREPAAKRQSLVESFKRKSISLPTASCSLVKRKSILVPTEQTNTQSSTAAPISPSEWHLHLNAEMPDTARMQQLFSWSVQRLLDEQSHVLGQEGKAACSAMLERIQSKEINTSWYANRKQTNPFQHKLNQLIWTIRQRINSIKPVLSESEAEIVRQNNEIVSSLSQRNEELVEEVNKKCEEAREFAYDLQIVDKFREESVEFVEIVERAVNGAYMQPSNSVPFGDLSEMLRLFSKSYKSVDLIGLSKETETLK